MENGNQHITSNHYRLIILINSSHIHLSVFDRADALISTKKHQFSSPNPGFDELVQLLTTDSQINYYQIRLIIESAKYSFVPSAIFRLEDAETFLHFEQKPVKDEQILIEEDPAWHCVDVFSIPENMHRALQQVFPEVPIEHHLSYILTEKVKPQTDGRLYIWTRQNALDVIVTENGKLKLINSYPYLTPEDFTYHALNVIEQLSLNNEKCKIWLFNSDKKPEIKKLLEKYVTVITKETLNN